MKKINKLAIAYLPIVKIRPYENNPRIHTKKSIAALVDSIKKYGFLNPILLDDKNVIICGHTRFYAAKQLKLKSVPVTYGTDLTPKQIKEFRILDNKTSENGQWDYTKLLEEVGELHENNTSTDEVMQSLGFDNEAFELMVNTRPIPPQKDTCKEIRIAYTSNLQKTKIINILNKHKIKYEA